MRIIGFNFDKIHIEKLKDSVENLNLNTGIDILDIKETKTDILKTKEVMLQVKFSYIVKYEPDFADINLKGTILLTLEEKEAKEVLKSWKNKKMPEDFRETLFNIILRKTALKSLHLEEEMNLPLHLPLPTIKFPKNEEKDKK